MEQQSFRPRDAAFVNFTIRYRIGTNKAYGTQLLPDISLNAVAKVTARLCDMGLLTRLPLVLPENYFRLGPKAVSVLGLSPRHCEPLGPQSLPVDYATLIYATQSVTPKRRLSPLELSQYTPWLPEGLRASPYCVAGDGRLDLIRVDLGGSPQHVARKVAAAANQRLSIPELADLAGRSKFQIAVLTTSAQKASYIAKALEIIDCMDAIRIHLTVIPQLSLLLLRGK
tara:strand:- start:39824 stop:40504 length:681 start_codon:yes stop_codon:yes gene_type:complete